MLSEKIKRVMYRFGWYSFPVPPVYTGNWNTESWIKFIDLHGRWWIEGNPAIDEILRRMFVGKTSLSDLYANEQGWVADALDKDYPVGTKES